MEASCSFVREALPVRGARVASLVLFSSNTCSTGIFWTKSTVFRFATASRCSSFSWVKAYSALKSADSL
ncbi:hypothetical protein D3C81_1788150 [compost metagenome]